MSTSSAKVALRPRKGRLFRDIKSHTSLYLILLIPVVWLLVFHYWPMYGVQIAFRDYAARKGITGSPWVGFKHFQRFFASFHFWRLMRNTIGISLYSLIVGIPAPIILSLMFNELRSKRFKSIAQTISYAPNFISTVVVVTMILFFLAPGSNGIFNEIRKWLGQPSVNFIAVPGMFWHIYVWSGVWQGIGFGSVVYMAAIAGIPTEQYEAAIVDGCNKLKRIWYITIPGILPTIVIITILNAGNIMNVGFEKIYLLQNKINLEASQVIATYVYERGIKDGNEHSFAAAVGLFNNVVNFVILVLVNTLAKKVGETSLW